MKKTLIIILTIIFAVGSVIGVTAAVSKNTKNAVIKDNSYQLTSSEVYEVVEFIPPQKTVYSLSDVYTTYLGPDENGKENFVQNIDFDGTGMSMTVKNKETGKVEKHDYICEYFDLEGKEIKCEKCLSFKFEPGINTVLKEGIYTTSVILTTHDSHTVIHEMEFTLISDEKPVATPHTEPQTQAPTKTPTNPVTDKSESSSDDVKQTEDDELVMPDITRTFVRTNDPSGSAIIVNSQNGNTLDLTISISNENSTKIAYTDVTVTLQDLYYDGAVVRGEGYFDYTDSFGNAGTGSVAVSENVIILVINEEYNSGRGFGITYTTGKYI